MQGVTGRVTLTSTAVLLTLPAMGMVERNVDLAVPVLFVNSIQCQSNKTVCMCVYMYPHARVLTFNLLVYVTLCLQILKLLVIKLNVFYVYSLL